jgi:predicted house-cleaning noncanonical NTP pyrophosphatase (MazG superfamily)
VNIKIVNDYETEKKPIKDIYKQFKEQYRIPSNLFQLIEECNSLKYYYSQDEREKYLDAWCSKLGEEVEPFSQEQYFMYNELSLENQHIGEIQRTHYLDTGCICTGCKRKRQIMLYKISRGETVDEAIDHTQANTEYNALLAHKKKQKMNKLLQVVSRINQLNSANKKVKPRNILKGSFVKQIK